MNTKRVTRVICLALAALLVFSLLASAIASSAFAVTQADIDALESQKDNIQAQQEEIQSNISALEDEQATMLEKKAALDEQNELTRQEIELIDEQIEIYDKLIENKKADLEAAKEAEEEQYERFCTRMRAMEENGNLSYLSILFDASSFSDLLSRIDFVSEIMSYDNQLEDELTTAREQLATATAEYEEVQAENQAAQEELLAKKAELEEQVEEAYLMIKEIEENIQENQEAYLENEQAEEALDAEITAKIQQMEEEKKAAEEAAQNNANNGGSNGGGGGTSTPSTEVNAGGFIWPTTGTYVSSSYGYRIHPIFGYQKFHSGIDIAVGAGQPIYAAASGTVSVAVYSSSYGNYVMLNHNNGYYTLYAHMTSYCVSVGQSVSQGQVIGYVGSTGWSTGPHLHYEVRNASGTLDPMSFY